MNRISRREFSSCLAALAAGVLFPTRASSAAPGVITRPIPSSGERLPAVGLGTARVFDVGDDARERARLSGVLRDLVAGGGSIVDTATAYGSAEAVVGDLVAQAGLRKRVFIATKLEDADAEELRSSLARLRTAQVDLLQLHNVRDPRRDLAPFRAWKRAGACRYIGITSTFERDYPALEAVLARERPDFIEIGYSIDNREAEKRLLPLAAQTGTANPAHMIDNLGAMRGRLPDAAQRRRMVALVESL